MSDSHYIHCQNTCCSPCPLAYTCSLSAPSGPGTTQVRILINSAKDGCCGNMWCACVVKGQHGKHQYDLTKANVIDRASPVVVHLLVAVPGANLAAS